MQSYDIAVQNPLKYSSEGKKYFLYEMKVRNTIIFPNDRVLLRNLSERGGTGKLRSYWEPKNHVVVKRVSEDNPVYEIRPEDGRSGKRKVHKNLLCPCDVLPLDAPPPDKPKRTNIQKTDKLPEEDEPFEDNDWQLWFRVL